VRSIALEVGLQNRKENTASSVRLFDFALDRLVTVRSIAPNMGDTFTHTWSHFSFLIKKKKKKHVHVVLKFLVDLKNCDLIFIG
jgi:hypothetical protein